MTGFLKVGISPIILAVGVATSACQTTSGPDPVSLDEAKKITAEFEGQTFVPPPRTIDDITAVLDTQRKFDPAMVARMRAAATAKPPVGLQGVELGQFLYDRGMAARRIGDVRRQINDLKEAARLSEDGDAMTRMQIFWHLSVAEVLIGNLADALQHREISLELTPVNRRASLSPRNAMASFVYARSGDLVTAEQRLATAEDQLVEYRFSPSSAEWGAFREAHVQRAKAYLLDIKGRHTDAEPIYYDALERFQQDSRNRPNNKYRHLLLTVPRSELGLNLMRQGRLVEAEVEARKALTEILAGVGRYSTDTALVLQGLVQIISAQGRAAEAERLSRALVDIYQQIGAPADSFQLAMARRDLGNTLVDQQKWPEALEQFERIEAGLAGDRAIFERVFATDLAWALALLGSGRVDEARGIAAAAVKRNRETVGAKHYNTAEAQGVLAIALARLDDRKAALAAFGEAIPILLTRSRQAEDESTTKAARARRLDWILEGYIDLLAEVRNTDLEHEARIDAAAEAFRIADVARGRSVQRALSSSAVRAAAKDPDLVDLVRREQDAQKQIAALYGLLANAAESMGDQRNASAVNDLRTRIDDLRGARAALMEEIEGRFPDYAALMNPKPATVEQVRAGLGARETLVATYVGQGRSYVWAVPKSGAVSFAVAPLGRKELSKRVASLRRALDPEAEVLGDIPDFDVAGGYDLYAALLKPVEKGWQSAKHLIVVAHGPLGQLPLSVLPTKRVSLPKEQAPLFSKYRSVPWLARSHAVSYAPSVSSFLTLRRLPGGDVKRLAFAGFGDPVFGGVQAQTPPAQVASRGRLSVRGLRLSRRSAPSTRSVNSADLAALPRLPDTADEVKSIAVALNADPTRDVFVGSRANEDLVKSTDLSNRRVLAFATHGLVPGDLNGLTQPALALSSPASSGGKEDGLLTMGEILGLRLDADWVILSACNTASADGAGAEAVSGLGRAFFYAGARALLVSHWPVETTSARALTTSIFALQAKEAGLSRAAALQRSMLSLIDGPGRIDARTNKTLYSYAHPLFWAPFTLIGEGQQKQAGS